MPTYSIQGPDGKTYSIDGPVGASRDDVIAQIKSRMQPPSDASQDQRGAFDKLFGIGGPRYQTWPERLVRGIGSDVGELIDQAAVTPPGPEGGAALAPQAFKVAAETALTTAPAAEEGLGNVAAAAERGGRIATTLPTKEANYASAKAAYKAVQDARLIVHEGALNNLVSAARAGLDDRFLLDSKVAQRALSQLEASGGDVAGIMNVWERLGEVKPAAGEDYAAAQHIRDAIGDFIGTVPATEIVSGDPKFTKVMWDHARASWRSYAQQNQIQTAMDVGRHRAAVAGTGANSQNAMRQRIREILDSDKSRRFSPEAKQQMENIVMGTWLTNAARYAGKFAPSGPVSAMAPVTAYFAGGGGEHGAMYAAAVAIPATIAKYLGTYLTKQQIDQLDQIIASESPLGKAAVKAARNAPRGPQVNALQAATPALVPGAASALSQNYP